MISTKNIFVFAIPYLIVVCGLYHLIYFGMFGLNGLDLVSVGEIIKTAVYPLILTFIGSALGVLFAHKLYSYKKKAYSDSGDQSVHKFWEPLLKFVFLLIFNSLLIEVYYLVFKELNLLIVAFAVGNLIIGFLNPNELIGDDIGRYINKEYLVMLLVYLPFFSLATAFQDSIRIIDNKSYKYTVLNQSQDKTVKLYPDTLKLIGISGQRFILTDLYNQKLYFMESDSMVFEKK